MAATHLLDRTVSPPALHRHPVSHAHGAREPSWRTDPRASAMAAGADRETRVQLLADVNRTAGNAAAANLVRLATLQREDGEDPYGDDAEAAGYTLTSPRFTPHRRLQEIVDGGPPLSRKDPSAVVKAAQTALLDIGYSLLRYKDDGSFGGETAEAIALFRSDRGISEGEGLDGTAMRALDRAAPPPGQQTQHDLDYSRLFADGRLDVTLAIGYDEGASHFDDLAQARAWFVAQKLTKQGGAEPPKPEGAAGEAAPEGAAPEGAAPPDPDAATRKGLSVPETWTGTRSVTYPDKDGSRVTKDIVVSITLVPPGTGGKAAFAKGLNESELSLYSGHARMGIGPDFDADKSPYENFVIGVGSALHKAGRVQAAGHAAESHYVIGKKNDLEAMKGDEKAWDPEKYRVWFFNACSSIAYIDELRGGLLPEKMDRHNLDLFGTTQEIPILAGLAPVFANIEGVLAAESMEAIVERMQRSTLVAFRKAAEDLGAAEAKIARKEKQLQAGAFVREGAGDNPVAASP